MIFLTPSGIYSLFQKAKDHWIPFRLAKPGEEVNGFSHNDYTELIFSTTPTNGELEKKFNKIFFNDDAQGLNLMKALWGNLDDNKKERFYKKFSLLLNMRIKNMPSHKSKKRAEIYMDKLEMLYNDFFSRIELKQNDAERVGREIENSISLPQVLNWNGKDVELFELIDALYRCGKLPGATQQQILNWINLAFQKEYKMDKFQKSVSEVRIERKNAAKFLFWLTEAYKATIKRS